MGQIADILNAAADTLTPEGAWTQGLFARDVLGRPCGPNHPNAVCWCIAGVIFKHTPPNLVAMVLGPVYRALDRPTANLESLAGYNDHRRRTQIEVVEVLRKAAGIALTESV